MTELKPCPFCGGDVFGRPDENQKVKYVHCITCGTEGPAAHTMEDAADKWNTRQSPWISVGDRLPEEQGFYFSLDDCGRGNVDWFSGKDFENEYLTHWMPIPPTQGD
jgi:Lar family restriction alleviation protein